MLREARRRNGRDALLRRNVHAGAVDLDDVAFDAADPDPVANGQTRQLPPCEEVGDVLAGAQAEGKHQPAADGTHEDQHEPGHERDVDVDMLQAHDDRDGHDRDIQ